MLQDDRQRLAAAVAEAGARLVMPRFRRLTPRDVATKSGPADLVTIADTEAEAAITDAVRDLWPGALVVGEEATEDDPSLPDGLVHAARAVVIDPVDGTWNFRAGLPAFGMMLAVTETGRTTWGMIHDPVIGDRVEAAADGPAEIVHADGTRERLSTSDETEPALMTGFMPLALAPAALRPALAAAMPGFGRASSLRCAAHEYRLVASGHASFLLAIALKPWDHLAGALIVERAGGCVRLLDGRPYGPGETRGPLLVAGSEAAWERVAHILRPIFRSA